MCIISVMYCLTTDYESWLLALMLRERLREPVFVYP